MSRVGCGLLALGFCSSAGGLSSSANTRIENNLDEEDDESFEALASGYGFASFCFIVAFLLFMVAAVCISPLMCGSTNEKKVIRAPQEVDTGYSAYKESGGASAPPHV
jgi:hypothetical protein